MHVMSAPILLIVIAIVMLIKFQFMVITVQMHIIPANMTKTRMVWATPVTIAPVTRTTT